MGQGNSVRYGSEPDIPSRLYGSDVPSADLELMIWISYR